MIRLKVADAFSDTPGARFRTDGPFSGEEFREDILMPILHKSEKLEINLDDTEGYPPSFLEESFGGIVRLGYMTAEKLLEKLSFVSSDEVYINQIKRYILNAKIHQPSKYSSIRDI